MTTKKKFFNSDDFEKKFGRLTFADLLSSFRLSAECTQIQFAKKLSISSANLCDLEKGRKIPSPTRAAKIAKKLGLSESLLIAIALQDQLEKEKFHFKVVLEAV